MTVDFSLDGQRYVTLGKIDIAALLRAADQLPV